MNLPTKLCQYCKSEIPKDASVCPVCKRKQTKTINHIGCGTIIGLLLAAFIVFAVCSGDSDDDYTPANSDVGNNTVSTSGDVNQSVEVTSQTTVDYVFDDVMTLIEEYKDNEVAADAKYKDKIVQFTGVVGSIGKDFLDEVYITVGDGTEITWDYAQCYFKKQEQIDKVTNLHEGDTVTVIGKVGSYSLSLSVKKCEIVD